MTTQSHTFTSRAGQQVVRGKNHFPAMLRLRIPREDLLELAQQLISRYQHDVYEATQPAEHEIALFGEMVRDPTDDLEHPE